jgi:hypothetical protein
MYPDGRVTSITDQVAYDTAFGIWNSGRWPPPSSRSRRLASSSPITFSGRRTTTRRQLELESNHSDVMRRPMFSCGREAGAAGPIRDVGPKGGCRPDSGYSTGGWTASPLRASLNRVRGWKHRLRRVDCVSAKDNMSRGWALAVHELVEPRYWNQG